LVFNSGDKLTLSGNFGVNSNAHGGSFTGHGLEVDLSELTRVSVFGRTAGGTIKLSQEISKDTILRAELVATASSAGAGNPFTPGSVQIHLPGTLTIRNRIESSGPVSIDAGNIVLSPTMTSSTRPLIESDTGGIKLASAGKITFGNGTELLARRSGGVNVHANTSDGSTSDTITPSVHSTPALTFQTDSMSRIAVSFVEPEVLALTVRGSNNMVSASNGSVIVLDTSNDPSKIDIGSNVSLRAISYACSSISSGDGAGLSARFASSSHCWVTFFDDANAFFTAEGISLKSGSLLIGAHRNIVVQAASIKAYLPKGSLVCIERVGASVRLQNLSHIRTKIDISNKITGVVVEGSEEFCLGTLSGDAPIATRNHGTAVTTNGIVSRAEISLLSFISKHKFGQLLRTSPFSEHRRSYQNLTKTAASLAVLRSHLGPFSLSPD
jgi:hypothetical protein